MDIDSIFDEVASQMNSDLEKARSSFQHSGLKGDSFENIFRNFLRNYLPEILDISTGTVVDSNGNQSKQLDVIISDKMNTPIFYKNEKSRVIPVECLYSVIEVKANLDSQELKKCFANMISVKELKKKAYIQEKGPITQKITAYSKQWDIWPTNYYIFSYDSIDLWKLAESMRDFNDTRPIYSRIDTICVLNKGVITNRNKKGYFDALPSQSADLFVCETQKALLLFYALTSKYFFQVHLPKFRFIDYINSMGFGKKN
jgi:translation elongation factor P/translation initiation factor 5A